MSKREPDHAYDADCFRTTLTDPDQIAADLEDLSAAESLKHHDSPEGHAGEHEHDYSPDCLVYTLVDEGVDLNEAKGRAVVLDRLITHGLCPRCGQDTLGIPGAARIPACRTVKICSACSGHEVFRLCPVRVWPIPAEQVDRDMRRHYPDQIQQSMVEAREELRERLVRERWAAVHDGDLDDLRIDGEPHSL